MQLVYECYKFMAAYVILLAHAESLGGVASMGKWQVVRNEKCLDESGTRVDVNAEAV